MHLTIRLRFLVFLSVCVSFLSFIICGPPAPAVSTVSLLSQTHPIEIHHSIKPPLDKSQVYWNYGGSTVLTKNFVRLVPSTQDRRGWLWNEYPLESTNWETEIRFEVFSKPHFGGDGMAFWVLAADNDPSFAQNPNALTGPLFGLKTEFTGFGVIFDVYDNDGKRNNPAIFVLQNTKGGTYKYNHDNDFENDMVTAKPEQLPLLPGAEKVDIAPSAVSKSLTHRCVADFRNTGKVNKALIRFLHNILHVYIDTADGMGYKFCLAVRLDDKFANHHFALSGATGQVADNMDILEVTTRYLSDADNNDINDDNLPQLGNSAVKSQHNTLMGMFWFFLSALQFFLILISIWQYRTLDTMKRGRIDENNIAKELNSIVMPHYSAQLFATVLLLLWGTWGTLICNLPLAIYRIYLIAKNKYAITVDSLVGTKEHTKTAKLSLENLLRITVANYALLQIYYLYKLFF